MAVRRIDEYGHIIMDDEQDNNSARLSSERENIIQPDELFVMTDQDNQEATSNQSQARTQINVLQPPTPWYGNAALFWIVTMVLVAPLALIAVYFGPMVFGESGSSSGSVEGIVEVISELAPYIMAIGAYVGAIWYNTKGTKKDKSYYTVGNYFGSVGCACAGVLGAGLLMFLIGLAVMAIAFIFAAVIAIAIIASLIGG